MNVLFPILFGLLVLVQLYSCLNLKKKKLRRFTKPLLVPLLIASYIAISKAPAPLVIAGLAFLFLGNTCLTFPEKRSVINLGYICFSLAGLLLSLSLLLRIGEASLPFLAIGIGAYSILIGIFLYTITPYLPPNRAALFALTACLTALTSLMGLFFAFTNPGAAPKLVYLGTLLLMLSGLIHSLHLYRKRIHYGTFFMMVAYIASTAFISFSLIGFGRI